MITAVDVSGGVITRRQSVQNDDGTWDNTETVTTAVCQMEAEVSYQRTPRVMRAEYLRRNMPQCEVDYVDPSSGAVNRQMAYEDMPIPDGAEVGILPPVTGG